MDPQRQLALLLEFSDMLRISLAGNLKDFQVVNAAGELVRRRQDLLWGLPGRVRGESLGDCKLWRLP